MIYSAQPSPSSGSATSTVVPSALHKRLGAVAGGLLEGWPTAALPLHGAADDALARTEGVDALGRRLHRAPAPQQRHRQQQHSHPRSLPHTR